MGIGTWEPLHLRPRRQSPIYPAHQRRACVRACVRASVRASVIHAPQSPPQAWSGPTPCSHLWNPSPMPCPGTCLSACSPIFSFPHAPARGMVSLPPSPSLACVIWTTATTIIIVAGMVRRGHKRPHSPSAGQDEPPPSLPLPPVPCPRTRSLECYSGFGCCCWFFQTAQLPPPAAASPRTAPPSPDDSQKEKVAAVL
jgi:hypothetical protein